MPASLRSGLGHPGDPRVAAPAGHDSEVRGSSHFGPGWSLQSKLEWSSVPFPPPTRNHTCTAQVSLEEHPPSVRLVRQAQPKLAIQLALLLRLRSICSAAPLTAGSPALDDVGARFATLRHILLLAPRPIKTTCSLRGDGPTATAPPKGQGC